MRWTIVHLIQLIVNTTIACNQMIQILAVSAHKLSALEPSQPKSLWFHSPPPTNEHNNKLHKNQIVRRQSTFSSQSVLGFEMHWGKERKGKFNDKLFRLALVKSIEDLPPAALEFPTCNVPGKSMEFDECYSWLDTKWLLNTNVNECEMCDDNRVAINMDSLQRGGTVASRTRLFGEREGTKGTL